MLLTRLADNIYWIGRFLERTECTARLVATHTQLSFDTPPGRSMTWDSLKAAGTGEPAGLCPATEEEVIAALITDTSCPTSLVSSIAGARENMRSARQRFPREAWEAVNRLNDHALEGRGDAYRAARRVRYLEQLIVESHKLTGILHATMIRDSAYSFYSMGQNIERAQATMAVVSVDTHLLTDSAEPFDDVRLMHVLKSLAAFETFRRVVPDGASHGATLNFLLQDHRFPRSVAYCLDEIAHRLKALPNSDGPIDHCQEVLALVADAAHAASGGPAGLRHHLDRLEGSLHALHATISAAWLADRASEVGVARAAPAPAPSQLPDRPIDLREVDELSGTAVLDEEDCWELLEAHCVGRVAVTVGGEIDVFPVNYGVEGHGILFRTNAGRKLSGAYSREVSFQIDGVDPVTRSGWSVVVHGEARDVSRYDGPVRQHAVQAWSGPKDFLMRISARTLSGRRLAPHLV